MRKIEIDESSFAYEVSRNVDYKECYEVGPFNQGISMKNCLELFFANPRWIDWLYKIRSVLVKPFGLSADTYYAEPNTDIKKGDKCGFLQVLEYTENEILLFGTDKHLEAWCSVYCKPSANGLYVIKCSTMVLYHNLLGKVYFTLIRPFHYLVVCSLLQRIQKKENLL